MATKHYVCAGTCNGISEMPGLCQDPTCPRFGKPLMECKCEHHEFNKNVAGVVACENCGKICDGNCAIESFKPELTN